MNALTVTKSGAQIDLLAATSKLIRVSDISEGLAKLNRWTGATSWPLSVAEHSVLVGAHMAKVQGPLAGLYGLLHDAHEYLIGDLTEPTARALEHVVGPSFAVSLALLRERLDAEIHRAFGIGWPRPPGVQNLFVVCHRRVTATEVRDLLASTAKDFARYIGNAPPLPTVLVPCRTWVQAEAKFKDALSLYLEQAGLVFPDE